MLRYGEAKLKRKRPCLLKTISAYPSALSSLHEEHAEASSNANTPERHDESAEFYSHLTKKVGRHRKYFRKEKVSDNASRSLVNIEEDEAQINTFHEGTNNDNEGDSIHQEMDRSPSPEIEAMLTVHTRPQRPTIERRASSSNTNSAMRDFNTSMQISFGSSTNSDNVEEPSETSINIDNLPRICAKERISVNENKKPRPRLKRVFSYPENTTKRFKAAHMVHKDLLVNKFTQTEEVCNANKATQTDAYIQVRSVQLQTEEAATNNIGIQTEIRKVDMIDAETQTDNFLQIIINVRRA